jgi:hypothetical protein
MKVCVKGYAERIRRLREADVHVSCPRKRVHLRARCHFRILRVRKISAGAGLRMTALKSEAFSRNKIVALREMV